MTGKLNAEIFRTLSLEVGLPVKGYSFLDEQVITMLIIQLIVSKNVILLSKNTKMDVNGLRWIHMNKVSPSIQQFNQGRFGILAFMKKGKISWQNYADEFLKRLRSSGVQIGFEYIEI